LRPTDPISLEVNPSSNTFLAVGEGVGYCDTVGRIEIEGLLVGAILIDGPILGPTVGMRDTDGSKLGIVDTEGRKLG
jgi:hypothetical protein